MTVSEVLKSICTMDVLFFTIILLQFYSPTHSEWISHSDNSMPRDDTMFAVGRYNDSIYLLGGFDKKRQQTIYDTKTNSFVYYKSGFVPQGNKVQGEAQFFTQIGSKLYILDDILAHSEPSSNKITIFDMKTNSFLSEFDSMPIPMSDGMGRACITSSRNKIFINGGITTSEALKDTYVLNIDVNANSAQRWTIGAQMLTGRRSHSCIIHPENNILYSIGGASISTIEMIQIENIHDNTWTPLGNQLSNPMKGTRSFISGNNIIIIGGVNGRTYYDTIHIIDINTNILSLSTMKLAFATGYSGAIMANNIQYSFGGSLGTDIWQSFMTSSKSPTISPITQQPSASIAPSASPTTTGDDTNASGATEQAQKVEDAQHTMNTGDKIAVAIGSIMIIIAICVLFCIGIKMVKISNKKKKSQTNIERQNVQNGHWNRMESGNDKDTDDEKHKYGNDW